MKKENFEILIVENSKELLRVEVNILENAGFRVDTVTTGKEALNKLEEFPKTKLVLLSYRLPDITGFMLMEKLRKSGYQAKVIAVNALITQEIRDDFMEAGAFAVIEKPFNIRELVELCKQALSNGECAQ